MAGARHAERGLVEDWGLVAQMIDQSKHPESSGSFRLCFSLVSVLVPTFFSDFESRSGIYKIFSENKKIINFCNLILDKIKFLEMNVFSGWQVLRALRQEGRARATGITTSSSFSFLKRYKTPTHHKCPQHRIWCFT